MKLMIHDDSCGMLLDSDGMCPRCSYHPDMQSTAFQEVSEDRFQALKRLDPRRTFLGLMGRPVTRYEEPT